MSFALPAPVSSDPPSPPLPVVSYRTHALGTPFPLFLRKTVDEPHARESTEETNDEKRDGHSERLKFKFQE